MIYQYILHPDGSDEFTYVSPRCLNIYEIEPEEVMANSKLLWNMVYPDHVKLLQANIVDSVEKMSPFLSEHLITTPSQKLK
jgi:hypothetical protein